MQESADGTRGALFRDLASAAVVGSAEAGNGRQ